MNILEFSFHLCICFGVPVINYLSLDHSPLKIKGYILRRPSIAYSTFSTPYQNVDIVLNRWVSHLSACIMCRRSDFDPGIEWLLQVQSWE